MRGEHLQGKCCLMEKHLFVEVLPLPLKCIQKVKEEKCMDQRTGSDFSNGNLTLVLFPFKTGCG